MILAVAAAFAASLTACSDPGAFLNAVNTEAKESLDMFLVVTGVTPAKDSANVNPSSSIVVYFDRALDESTVSTSTVAISPAGSPSTLISWSGAYEAALKRLTLTPTALEGGTDYVVTLRKELRSVGEEPMGDDYAWSFRTANLPGGSVFINGSIVEGAVVNPEYATNHVVTLYLQANGLVDEYLASETLSEVQGTPATLPPPGSWTAVTFNLTEEEIEHRVYVRFKHNVPGGDDIYSEIVSDTIILDTTAPDPPASLSISSTATHAPTWTWQSSGDGDGIGMYRYRIYSYPAGSYLPPTGWTDIAVASYLPADGLSDGRYIFYVQERDAAGNWSAASSLDRTIDAPPLPPTVSATSPTLDEMVTWNWASGGFGSGTYRYALDPGIIFAWSSPSAVTGLTVESIVDGAHVLNVQERDAGGEWSSSGARTVVVTPCIPYDGQTNVSCTPTFSWRPAAAESYSLQFYTTRGEWTTFGTTSGTSLAYKGTLDTNTAYKWRVVYVSGKLTRYIPSETGASFTTTRFLRF